MGEVRVTWPQAPWFGRVLYRGVPIRRAVVLDNLRRAFGSTLDAASLERLAQAHYAHLARLVAEFIRFPWLSPARRRALVRVENVEAIQRVYLQGRGVLVLTAHLGNWEVAILGGLSQFPEHRGQFHALRRRLWPARLDRIVTRRFRRAGVGVLPKKGALDAILARLAAGDAIIFPFDQHAGGRDGVRVEFFGHPAATFRSLAILSLTTGVPVVPAATWREPDGRHVLRFEEALPIVEDDDVGAAIRANTRAYNAALERLIRRHPEQWFWMHRRWKEA